MRHSLAGRLAVESGTPIEKSRTSIFLKASAIGEPGTAIRWFELAASPPRLSLATAPSFFGVMQLLLRDYRDERLAVCADFSNVIPVTKGYGGNLSQSGAPQLVRQSAPLVAVHDRVEHIADATLRPDDAPIGRALLQLASQPHHLHVDAAVEDVLVQARRLQKMHAAQHASRRFEK